MALLAADAHGVIGFRSVRLAGLRDPAATVSARRGVPIPPLGAGERMLALLGLTDPLAGQRLPPHDSALHVLPDAMVQSDAGIVALERLGAVLEDTLDHTDPERDGYRRDPGDQRREGSVVWLRPPSRSLPGQCISLLLGNQTSHFHWLLMNLARLAIVPRPVLRGSDAVLVPADLPPSRRETLRRLGVLRGLALRPVAAGECLRVGRLVLPWGVATGTSFDPRVVGFLRRAVLGGAGSRSGPATRALYVDRRRSTLRPLLNEDEIVAALLPLGVEPVRLEDFSLTEQAKLFAGARLVVAPHGAGLANLVFAPPGAHVVELLPSGCVNWCYRILAATCGHGYDAVIGRSVPIGSVAPIWQPWRASATHVVAALPPATPMPVE